MARCEDFPCCGHGNDPGGCPDLSVINTCEDCGTKFHPDNMTGKYCYTCGQKPQTPKKLLLLTGTCKSCGETEVDLYKAQGWVACGDCHGEAEEQERANREVFGDNS